MKKIRFLFLTISLLFSSCFLFENDVADFMEKYTETAAIEQHSFSYDPYSDAASHACINSRTDFDVSLYMRNPKKFTMQPSVKLEMLPEGISADSVTINQTAFNELKLNFPASFLLATDEGKNISTVISLYEPMSGRTFDKYEIPLYCNSIPPQLQNATILNDGNQSFVLAFDMPSTEELGLRHKDISSININGTDYALSISDDGTWTFADSRFYTTPKASFVFINSKEFTSNANSIYFDTNDSFTEGEKNYTLGLKDSAGLIKTVFTSTTISRLSPPVVSDAENNLYTNGANEMVPGNETDPFTFTITPPSTDHKGNAVSGATINYALYKGTNTIAAVMDEGTSNTPVSWSLDTGTYYLETYATLINYEQSIVSKLTFRVVDNIIYVSEDGDDSTADGSKDLPWGTLNAAVADIDVRSLTGTTINLYVDGTINGNVVVNAVKTRGITITQRPGARPAVIQADGTTSAVKISTEAPVTFKNIKITGGNAAYGGGIYAEANTSVKLATGTVITANQASTAGGGIYLEAPSTSLTVAGTVTVYGNTISSVTGGAGTASNVYLKDGQLIEIDGALASTGSNLIGVTTQTAPTILAPVTITQGYGYTSGLNSGVIPGTYFIGDVYAVSYTSAGEAGLFLDEAGFDELLSTLDISFAINRTSFKVGTATQFIITPTVTVISGGTPVTVNYDTVKDKITWSIILMNGTQTVSGVSSSTNTITIPASVTSPDNYKLLVTATYDGIYIFDREFDITGTLN